MEPTVLSRRIEQLAALSGDESGGPDLAGLPAALSALRAEVAAVRAELGGLRGELGGVRADLDGLSGRLTGTVAANRTETGTLARSVAELSSRVEQVGGRVEDVSSDLPRLTRDLHEAIELLPGRAAGERAGNSERVTELLGVRVDEVAADVRRVLSAAQERTADATAASAAALADARTSVETRLAVLEGALDSLGERLEALRREGSQDGRDQLQRVTAGLVALESRVESVAAEQVERVVSRLREVTAARLDLLTTTLVETTRSRSDQLRRELVDLVVEANLQGTTTRLALEQLVVGQASAAEQVASGLAALGSRTAEVGVALREQVHGELDVVAERLRMALDSLEQAAAARAAETGARADALRESFDQRLEAVRDGLAAGLTELRTDLGAEFGVQRPQVEELLAGARAAAEAGSQRRTEVMSALNTVREQTTVALASSAESVQAALDQTAAASRVTAQETRGSLLARLEEQHELVTARLAELAAAASGERSSERALAERLAALVGSHEDLRRAVESLNGDWPVRLAEAQAAARMTAEAAVGELRAEVRGRLDDVLAEVGRAAGSVDQARVELSAAAEEVGAQLAAQRHNRGPAEGAAKRPVERAGARWVARPQAAVQDGATGTAARASAGQAPAAKPPAAAKGPAAKAPAAKAAAGQAPAAKAPAAKRPAAKAPAAKAPAAKAPAAKGRVGSARTRTAAVQAPLTTGAAAKRVSRPRPAVTELEDQRGDSSSAASPGAAPRAATPRQPKPGPAAQPAPQPKPGPTGQPAPQPASTPAAQPGPQPTQRTSTTAAKPKPTPVVPPPSPSPSPKAERPSRRRFGRRR